LMVLVEQLTRGFGQMRMEEEPGMLGIVSRRYEQASSAERNKPGTPLLI
jgi:hypothetical protein